MRERVYRIQRRQFPFLVRRDALADAVPRDGNVLMAQITINTVIVQAEVQGLQILVHHEILQYLRLVLLRDEVERNRISGSRDGV